MLEELIGQIVVLDLRGPFVCLGRLERVDEHYLEMRNADLHDLRDTQLDSGELRGFLPSHRDQKEPQESPGASIRSHRLLAPRRRGGSVAPGKG